MATNFPITIEEIVRLVRNSGCFALREVASAITAYYDRMLTPTGLQAADLALLRSCAARGQASLAELVQDLDATPAMIERKVRTLEAQRLVEASEHEKQAKWKLTPLGSRTLVAGIECWNTIQAQLKSQLGQERWESLERQCAEICSLAR